MGVLSPRDGDERLLGAVPRTGKLCDSGLDDLRVVREGHAVEGVGDELPDVVPIGLERVRLG